MNPLVHAHLSYLTAWRVSSRRDRGLITLAGLLPDVDGLTLLWGEEAYARWHHVLTHGFVAAVVVSLVLTALATQRRAVAVLSFAAFHLHLLCDLAGSGPGWPISYWWPMSHVEYFWSGQWNLASWQNALIGLVATIAVLWGAMPLGRTILELITVRGDAAVVSTLRRRFGRGSR